MNDVIAMTARADRSRRFAVAGCDDLVTGPARTVTGEDLRGLAPYGYHAPSDRLWLVNTPRAALEHSFLYAAQADATERVLTMRPHTLLERLPHVDWQRARPLLVLSIGRCGSTVASRYLGDLGWRSLSEPDVFDLATWELDVTRTDRALRAAAAAWMAFAGSTPDRTAFKFRSDLSSHVHVLRRAFPGARILFLTREVEAWAHSFVRAFGVDNRHLAGTLRHARRCLAQLAEANAPFAIVDHSKLARDPAVLLRALQRLGYAVDGDLEPRERHAQADERDRFEGMTPQKRGQVADFLAREDQPIVPRAAEPFVI